MDISNSATLQVATTRQGLYLNKQLQSFGRQDFMLAVQKAISSIEQALGIPSKLFYSPSRRESSQPILVLVAV